MEPYEIIGSPLTIWLAPVGTAFPAVNIAPSGSWTLLGTGGDKNYTEEGVQVMHDQTLNEVFTAGSTGARKVFRPRESFKLGVTLLDLNLAQYGNVLGTVTTVAPGAGTIGTKKVGLNRGSTVALFALLARGPSPFAAGMNAQFEVPRCYQSGNPRPTFSKGNPAGLAMEFAALEDPAAVLDTERFGRLIAQHLAAL